MEPILALGVDARLRRGRVAVRERRLLGGLGLLLRLGCELLGGLRLLLGKLDLAFLGGLLRGGGVLLGLERGLGGLLRCSERVSRGVRGKGRAGGR